MKLRMALFTILAVVSAQSLAVDAQPVINAPSFSAEATSGPIYVDFGEFVYRVVSLETSDHGGPIDVNNLSIAFIFSDAVDVWFDFVLA